jgi:hypothetical protein
MSDGRRIRYRTLLSTVPLKRLVGYTAPLPPRVEVAARRLEALDLLLVDVGFAGPGSLGVHWVYQPDQATLAYRMHLCHELSDELAPPGQGLYCLEVSHSRHRPLPSGNLQERIVDDLVRTGWLRTADQVTFYRERRFPSAYVLPRVGFASDAEVLLEHLRQLDILSIGRFGHWKYSNMEDALVDGRRVARTLADGRRGARALADALVPEGGRR